MTGSSAANTPQAGEITSEQFQSGARFDRAAWCYELLCNIYSCWRIPASKRWQIQFLEPGQRVLYVGVGTGDDAILAARKGADVTCVDLSKGMLVRAKRRIEKAGLSATFLQADATKLQPEEPYDVVVANYFLNCFRKQRMREVLAGLVPLVKPHGRFMIADIARPQGNIAYKFFHRSYNNAALFVFWIQGLVPWHRIFDYPAYFDEVGLELKQQQYIRLFPGGPICYHSMIAERVPPVPSQKESPSPQTGEPGI